ncbi:MAG: hypothetical protein Q9223_002562 [Gallowayella weberi]
MTGALQVRIEDAVAIEMKSSGASRKAGQPEVYDNMMRFFWDCARAFPVLNLTPSFLLPIVGPILMGWGISRRKIYDLCLELTQQALHTKDRDGPKPTHMVQWTMEATRIRDATDIAKMALGLVFASAFQVPMVIVVPSRLRVFQADMMQLAQSVLYRICKHPEYFDKLKAEAQESRGLSFENHNQEMPFMDSFIKESARLGAGPILSVPRKAMSDYTFPSGIIVPAGNWIAIPQLPLMRDPEIWPGGGAFDGFRFVDDNGRSSSRPARFYVSVIVKMVLTHLLTEYEFKLEDPNARPYFSFGKARLPNPFTTMLVRKRNIE